MEPEQGNTQQTKKTSKGFQMTWWLWTIIIIAVVGIAAVLVVKLTTKDTGATASSITTKPDTAEEIKIKQYMSSLRGDVVRYYEQNKSYASYKPSEAAVTQVKNMGSELKTQAMSASTYVIFAKMPSSKTIFCMDHNNYTGEVKSLMGWAKACK